jgi:hypothetical protein
MFDIYAQKLKRDKIDHFIKNIEEKNGMSISQMTEQLTKSGEYDIPKKYLEGLEYHFLKEYVKRKNYIELKKLSFFKKRKRIKQLLEQGL